ncbi:ABC transporter ATP-binding protein [Nitrincola alkalilacustris]|uniref:ABC transporter ATP-binding protein n=1 Tax=Nitrincola alkalilacustris TaxID=1571224 RepID=UPI00124BE1EE|nr:ABC transporter ATP-binding protein [Nitrincola alkalilacustris]
MTEIQTKAGLRIRLRGTGDIPLDVDLQCHPGELVALVGPSGSGKTTLLRALAGLYQQVDGSILNNGECWFDSSRGISLKPETRHVGMVFQSYALFPHLSARQNLLLALRRIPAANRTLVADQWLQRVNLSGLENRRPRQLSGGQRQRVALARALAPHPRLLLLDEPFSAVDQVTRVKLRRELVVLRQSIDIPTLLVTHDLDEALQLADRICVLHHGKQLQVATPDELMSHPATPVVARLLGMQNIFSAQVISRDDELLTLDWSGISLKIQSKEPFNPGDTLSWMAPPQSILLQRPDRPVPGDSENPVAGTISELVRLGPHASLRITPQHAPELPIGFYVPHHYVERQSLKVGMPVTLSLKTKAMHIFHSAIL